jgi:two-component system, OmpR family, sensor histidine kinase YxdK
VKLFFREHIPLLITYTASLLLTPLIYWLDGYHHLAIILYGMLVNSFLWLGLLLFRFFRLRSFYQRLSQPLTTLAESLQKTTDAPPLTAALEQLLHTQYQYYYQQIHRNQQEIRNDITFINQWIHQMKTPLSVIHLTIQERDEPIFDDIREELDRLQKGLEIILYRSRLHQLHQDLQVEPVNLHHMVTKVISENKRLFIRHHVYPAIHVDPHTQIHSDAKWLAFLFGQLITNAIRYSTGTRTKVQVSSYPRGKWIVLEVRDQGVGIPKQDIGRVFEPYFTGRQGRKVRESTGLGLYLVREICKKLDHQVELESAEGVGTTVRIILREAVHNNPITKKGKRIAGVEQEDPL